MKRNYIQNILKHDSSNNFYNRTYHAQSFLAYLSSQETAQSFLNTCYKRYNVEGSTETKSYENSEAFMYYLTHGLTMYDEGQNLPLTLQPMLYFYGMNHLLKACLLAMRPNYPESTAHLAHGVSSRKRKKKDYTFLTDEVRVQQKGLFPYFVKHLYHIDSTRFDKVLIKELLTRIPELQPLFQLTGDNQLIDVGYVSGHMLTFPIEILDQHNSTYETFEKRLNTSLPQMIEISKDNFDINVITNNNTELHEPFSSCFYSNKIFYPKSRSITNHMNEVMIHYLVLYNLSMLSRYEAAWWGDLISTKHNIDYPVIERFLAITKEKIPILLSELLQKQIKASS